jgi:stage IV sporulation protein FB
LKLGRVLGVQVTVNNLFLLLLVIYSATGYLAEALIVYGAALLHEVTHAVVAASYGLQVEEIEILPFGGVARIRDLDLSALNPEIEAVVALAGPVENLILAGVAWVLAGYGVWNISLAGLFIRANLGLAVFNLLPALPLDGGRLLRAYLAQRFSWRQATDIAARLGQALGAVLFCLGVVLLRYGLLFLNIAVLGAFLWWSATVERRWAGLVLIRYLTHKRQGLRRGQVVKGKALVAAGDTELGHVLKQFATDRYHLLYVLDKDNSIMAIISEDDLITGLITAGPSLTLRELIQKKK